MDTTASVAPVPGVGPVVIVLEQASTFQLRLAAGLSSVLEPLGVPLLVQLWGEDTSRPPAALLRILERQRPRAMVINPLTRGDAQQQLATLLMAHPELPRLYVCCDGHGGRSVRGDNDLGMRLVAEHVVRDCRARRVLVVRGINTHPDSQERERAVHAELARLGRPVDADRTVTGAFDRDVTRRAVHDALVRDPAIDAVIAFNDRSALGAIDAVETLGRRVPQDVVVTGYDDETFAKFCRPALTTVSQNLFGMGRAAGETLLRLLAGAQIESRREPVRLMTRASTARERAPLPPVDESWAAAELWGQLAALDVGLAMSREFMDCVTIEQTVEHLRSNLDVLGITRAYLVLCTDREGDVDGAAPRKTLAMAYRAGAADDAWQGCPVEADALLPHGLDEQLHQGTLVVQPLSVEGTDIGYLLLDQPLDRVPHTGGVLQMGLSRTIDTIRRTARLAERTHQLELEVASRRAAQQALVYQASHDALTGLANRDAFLASVDAVLADQARAATALLLVDVDRFKDVNDSLGHAVGDALLREIAVRLGELIGERGEVSRLGGDEFAIAAHDLRDAAEAMALAQEVLGTLRCPFRPGGVTLEIEASIGVGCAPLHASDAGTLLRMADLAMYAAKSARVGCALYDPEEHRNTAGRLALFGELRRALAENEFVVHYQPVVEVVSGLVNGVEALVRWEHPSRGLLPPSEFLEITEQTGLIHDLTTYVLDRSLRDCRIWLEQGLRLSTAVNLSTRRLMDAALPDQVSTLLRNHGIPAHQLVLEITETAAMADPGRSLAVLRRLRDLGVHLSVDDFGTGHASLAYLSRLPVHYLKIDRSFVLSMESDTANLTIVRSTLDLARNLGLGVIAEGVETGSAFRTLDAFGCAEAQGYWLARPGPAQAIPTVVDDVQRRVAAFRSDGGGAVPPQRRAEDREARDAAVRSEPPALPDR